MIITRVPRTASIEHRAEILREEIADKCKPGETLNLLGHSMVFPLGMRLMKGGLDARYMISVLRPTEFKVKSLTTIATPHRLIQEDKN